MGVLGWLRSIPLGLPMRTPTASLKSHTGFAAPLSIVCAFSICLCLIAIGLYLGRAALLYVLAGILIGGIVGMFLSYLWHDVLARHLHLVGRLHHRRICMDEPGEYESYTVREPERPLTPIELEERTAKQRDGVKRGTSP